MAKIIRLTANNGAIKEIPFVGKFKNYGDSALNYCTLRITVLS
jgi:hypothetical protein